MGEEGEGKEEGWIYFTARVDSRGRVVVPADERENAGIYKKVAQVTIKMKVLRFYGKDEKG